MNYQFTTVAFFVGCLLTAVIILFLMKKGVMLLEIFKTLNAIGRLSSNLNDEKKEKELLREQNKILKKKNEELEKEQKKQDSRIENLEEVVETQRKAIKKLAAADRDLDEWRYTMFETLTAISDLSPELIFKLTGHKKGETNGPL
jgi:septal ring factor EnvC (AmiA/AmiB activator)